MSTVLKSMSGYIGQLLQLCLQERLNQLSEGIEIINGILQCCQSISALNAHVWRNPVIILYCYWASEASPTLGCSIEISRDIYIAYYTSKSGIMASYFKSSVVFSRAEGK